LQFVSDDRAAVPLPSSSAAWLYVTEIFFRRDVVPGQEDSALVAATAQA